MLRAYSWLCAQESFQCLENYAGPWTDGQISLVQGKQACQTPFCLPVPPLWPHQLTLGNGLTLNFCALGLPAHTLILPSTFLQVITANFQEGNQRLPLNAGGVSPVCLSSHMPLHSLPSLLLFHYLRNSPLHPHTHSNLVFG